MDEALDALVVQAAADIGGATSCSVLVRHDGAMWRLASADERAARCDDVEARDSYGPCVLAMDLLHGTLVPDIGLEERWPAWCSEALAAGLRSGAAMPAYVGRGTAIALNLYAEAVDPWDAEALVRADRFAQRIARHVAPTLLGP